MNLIKDAIDTIVKEKRKQFVSPYTIASQTKIEVNEVNKYMLGDDRLKERQSPHHFNSFEVIGFKTAYLE